MFNKVFILDWLYCKLYIFFHNSYRSLQVFMDRHVQVLNLFIFLTTQRACELLLLTLGRIQMRSIMLWDMAAMNK